MFIISRFIIAVVILTALATALPQQSAPPRGRLRPPIQDGYVAFGDSYAAGLGTSTTKGKCRVGQSNYPQLLYDFTIRGWGKRDIDFQSYVCSGDTIVGLNGQIDKWHNPGRADIATVSIGGNDLDFSNLVWHCILNPSTSDKWSARCDEAQANATKIMAARGDDSLFENLKSAYRRILSKSGRPDFNLYVTGYSVFFNQDTNDCKDTTFWWWWPSYEPGKKHGNRKPYLEKPLRRKLNDLVGALNTFIQEVIRVTNEETGTNQVAFVDVSSRFDTHRWCESEDIHEPAPGRKDTWFFLSSWPDVDEKDDDRLSAASARQDLEEVLALINAGSVQLPDPKTCQNSLGTDPDPADRLYCMLAKETADHASLAYQYLRAANYEIAAKKVDGRHIGYFTVTRWMKTFHPRTPGMLAYRRALTDAIYKHYLASGSDIEAFNTTHIAF